MRKSTKKIATVVLMTLSLAAVTLIAGVTVSEAAFDRYYSTNTVVGRNDTMHKMISALSKKTYLLWTLTD
jgi:hypothetical protein